MQSIASTLPYFFAIIILVGILWMVIQKVSVHLSSRSFKHKFGNEDDERSDVSNNDCKSQSCSQDMQQGIRASCNSTIVNDDFSLQVRDGSIKPCQNKFCSNSPQFLSSEAFNYQHGAYCKTKLDVKMTSDTDTTMAEPQSTNYNSGDGETAPSPSSGVAKSGLSRRQRKNCRKREKLDNENKLLGLSGGKSVESTGLPTISCPLSGSSTSLNSQKDGSSGGGKKRSSGSLKDRESYGRYKTLDTYERLQGMSDQQIYYWIYSYCLDMTRLRHLGFPLDSELHPGKTIVYVDPEIGLRSCTKGEGDLNSLEFCVDDFSSNDVKPESISITTKSQDPSTKIFQIIPMQIEQDDIKQSKGLALENENSNVNISQEESQTNTQSKTDLEEILCQPSTGAEDIEELSSTEEDQNILSSLGDNANLSQSSGVLDVNAQEFIPSNSNVTETLPIPSRDLTSTPVSLSANAKEFYPSYSNPSPLSVSLNASESEVETRKCARCDKVFEVIDGAPISKEKCLYHWGKKWHYEKEASNDYSSNRTDIRGKPQNKTVSSLSHQSHSRNKSKSQFTCCNARALAQGCCTAKSHVWRGKLFDSPGMHGPFTGYVRTKKRKHSPSNGYHGVYAIDCEMCYTTNGMEIARLSVVGIDGRPVYDSLIQPENPIIDYNTRFSGLTERDFRRGENNKSSNNSSSSNASGPPVKSLREVQNDLMGFISASTIIVGHGLENDFRALNLVHSLVVDTSTLYPHFFGLPYRRSLKSLAKSYLKRDIQTGTHDSLEDARASLELVLCQVKAESEGMSNAIKGTKDGNSPAYLHSNMSQQYSSIQNNAAVLNASIGEMNRSGILFNSNAMNPGVLPHVSSGSSIAPVSTFLAHRPGIK